MESRSALLDQCLNEFERGKWSSLTPQFMKKAQEEFVLALAIVRKYLGDPEAFEKLKSFVNDLEFGHWTTAREEFPSAKKEYVKFLKVVEDIKTPKWESADKSIGNTKGTDANTINGNKSGTNMRPKSYVPPKPEGSQDRDDNNRPSSYGSPRKNNAADPEKREKFPAILSKEGLSEHPNWIRRVRPGKLGESRLGRPGAPEPYEETAERYQPYGPGTYKDERRNDGDTHRRNNYDNSDVYLREHPRDSEFNRQNRSENLDRYREERPKDSDTERQDRSNAPESTREDRPRVEDKYRKTRSDGLDAYKEDRSNDFGTKGTNWPEGPNKLRSDRPGTYRKNQNEGTDMSKEDRSIASDPDRPSHSNGSDRVKHELRLDLRKSSDQEKPNTTRDARPVESVRDRHKEEDSATQDHRGKNPNNRQDDDSGETLDNYNRAVRLAERFADLYKKEYVEAFGELKRHRYFERDAVFYLLRFVKHAYDFCLLHRDRMLDEEVNGLDFKSRAAIRSRQLDEGFRRLLLQRRKRTANLELSRVLKEYFDFVYERLLPHYPLDEIARMKIRHYVERSLEIVWGFCTQVPSVCMKWPSDRKQGERVDLFNLEFYLPYTKPEKYVDYCVWPLLLLHENGPILKKGIVQGLSI